MDPHAVSTATHPGDARVTSAPALPRKPASRARWGLPIAALIGAWLVASFLFMLGSSNVGIAIGDNKLVCVSGGDNNVITSSRGDIHDLCSQKSFSAMPADDAALEAWLRAQPGVEQVEIRRVGGRSLGLRLEYLHSGRNDPQWLLSPPWEEL